MEEGSDLCVSVCMQGVLILSCLQFTRLSFILPLFPSSLLCRMRGPGRHRISCLLIECIGVLQSLLRVWMFVGVCQCESDLHGHFI